MQELRRIVIEGTIASEVQGAELREDVQKIARQLDIKGRVRNIKGKPEVEIICESEKSDLLYQEIKKLKETKNKLYRIEDVKEPSEDLFDFNRFEVVREDDLSEMVWGLQGAGKAFKFLAEYFMRMKMEKEKSMLMGLKYELSFISNHVGLLRSNERRSEFNLVAIENFLKEPLSDNEDLMMNLRDIYETCQDTNSMIKSGKLGNDIQNNLERISKLTKVISEKLEQIKAL